MRKYIFALILGCGIVLQYQSVFSQEYIEGNTYYDKNGKAYFYDANGKAFYYPEPVEIDNITVDAQQNSEVNTQDNQLKTVDKNILADEALMKTITPEQLEKYLSQGADVNVKFIRKIKNKQDENKIIEIKDVTPLMMAALGNPDVKVIELLLENGADIKAQNENSRTAFMHAAQENSNPEVIETLLKHGADIETKDNYGWTSLMYAARDNENQEVIETLLKHGADVNAKDEDGKTALLIAARYNENPEIIETLLKHGADINAKYNNGVTALMLAVMRNSNPKIIKKLFGIEDIDEIKATMGNPNPEIIEILLKHGADVNAALGHGTTALMLAALTQQNPKIIETLLKYGADVNAYVEDITFSTAAFFALANPNHQIFEMLMKGEIDKFCRINSNYSADIYYCKDRLTNYMKKEHMLPSCTYDIGAMMGLTPVFQIMQRPDPGKGAYAFVVLAELTSQLNCSITNTFKELGMFDALAK